MKDKIYPRKNIYLKLDLFMAYVKNACGFRYERFNNSKKLSADTFWFEIKIWVNRLIIIIL